MMGISTWLYTAEVIGYRTPVEGIQYEYIMRQIFTNTTFFGYVQTIRILCVWVCVHNDHSECPLELNKKIVITIQIMAAMIT